MWNNSLHRIPWGRRQSVCPRGRFKAAAEYFRDHYPTTHPSQARPTCRRGRRNRFGNASPQTATVAGIGFLFAFCPRPRCRTERTNGVRSGAVVTRAIDDTEVPRPHAARRRFAIPLQYPPSRIVLLRRRGHRTKGPSRAPPALHDLCGRGGWHDVERPCLGGVSRRDKREEKRGAGTTTAVTGGEGGGKEERSCLSPEKRFSREKKSEASRKGAPVED